MNARLSRRPMCRLTAATVAFTCNGNPLRAWSQAGAKWPEPSEANRIAYEAYISSRLRAPAALARERTPKLSPSEARTASSATHHRPPGQALTRAAMRLRVRPGANTSQLSSDGRLIDAANGSVQRGVELGIGLLV